MAAVRMPQINICSDCNHCIGKNSQPLDTAYTKDEQVKLRGKVEFSHGLCTPCADKVREKYNLKKSDNK